MREKEKRGLTHSLLFFILKIKLKKPLIFFATYYIIIIEEREIQKQENKEENKVRELFESKVAEVIRDFEVKSGINGLAFEFEEKENYRKEKHYELIAKVPTSALGIMSNNMRNVQIIISFRKTQDGEIYYDAKFEYEHKDGGRNGMDVMTVDGLQPVRGIIK